MLSIVMACEARLPTSAEVDKMDVASAEKAVVQAKLLDGKEAQNVVYKIDGVVVTAAVAHAMSSKHIASVSVSKSGTAHMKGDSTAFAVVSVSTSDTGSGIQGVPMKITYKNGTQHETIETAHGTLTGSKGFTGLLFVDGVLAPEGSMAKLSPNDIASVEVIKGPAAAKISTDPAAANGVIRVTTKHARQ
jgi:hypothetical protein